MYLLRPLEWWRQRQWKTKVIGCSTCFHDLGLREVAKNLGYARAGKCPSCGSSDGAKLTKSSLETACIEFFVRGSVPSGIGCFAPVVQFNYTGRPADEVGREALRKDIRRLLKKFGISVFLYGPPLWMLGKLPEDDGMQHWSSEDFQQICDYHCELELELQTLFYRVQRNIQGTPDDSRFCSPPDKYRENFGRFDSKNLPILYCSFDVETCLHESRVSLEDEIYVATLRSKRKLRILNLAEPKDLTKASTPFEDPTIWLTSLLYDHGSYETCQNLAKHIKSLGYDGFIVKSYFQQAATAEHRNLCLFDRPIVSGLVSVEGINKVVMNNVVYEYGFGPAIFPDEDYVEEEEVLSGFV